MCPQTTLWNLLEAYSRNDRQAINDCLESLREWNLKGGFSPEIDRPALQTVSHFTVRRNVPETETGPAPHYIHESTRAWCEEDGCESSREAWEREPAKRIDLKAGDHVLLPSDWLDDDSAFEGELTEVAVVQREFPPDVADGDLRYWIVTPLFDDYRETKLSANVLHWGRIQWLAENQTMGSGSHGAETFREGGGDDG